MPYSDKTESTPRRRVVHVPVRLRQWILCWRGEHTSSIGGQVGWWRWLLPYAVIVPMLVIAGLCKNKTLVFPEGAALAYGVFVLRNPGWVASRWRLLVVLPIAATLGLVIASIQIPLAGELVLGVTGVVVLLLVMRSFLTPSISAVLIPIVFQIHSWLYVATVIGVSALTLGIDVLVRRNDAAPRPPYIMKTQLDRSLTFVVVSVAWVLIATALRLPTTALAPPLFVSTYGLVGSNLSFRHALGRSFLFFALGFMGVGLLSLLHDSVVVGLVAVTVALTVMALTRRYHPPVLAVSLLALIAGPSVEWKFGLGLMVGSLALYGLNRLVEGSVQSVRRNFFTGADAEC